MNKHERIEKIIPKLRKAIDEAGYEIPIVTVANANPACNTDFAILVTIMLTAQTHR